MRSTDEQVRRIASMVAGHGDDEAVSRILQLGSLRYDRDTLIEMVGGARMGLTKAFIDGSSLIREERAEGREEGFAEGRVEGARKLLRVGLRSKFPKLEFQPEIDRISSIERLEALMEGIFNTSDVDSMRAALTSSADNSN
jgi:hypothetical protein